MKTEGEQMTVLAGSRKLMNAVEQKSLDKLVDGYLEVYNQVKHLGDNIDSPHELVMDILFDTIQEQKEELQKGKLGV